MAIRLHTQVVVRIPPEAVFSLKNNCLGRVVLCCFVFLLCSVALSFSLSISWIIKSCICWHTGVKKVQQMQEVIKLRSQVTQSQKSCHF